MKGHSDFSIACRMMRPAFDSSVQARCSECVDRDMRLTTGTYQGDAPLRVVGIVNAREEFGSELTPELTEQESRIRMQEEPIRAQAATKP